jgi:SAM-dependent methyltransferase
MAIDTALRAGEPTTGNPRLHPRRWSSRYYVLRGLRDALNEAFAAHIGPGMTVLDFGCGSRPYEPLVLARGAAYVGVDLPGVPGAALQLGEDGRIDVADGTADAVLSTQVLEHVPDPAAYLGEARRVLRTDGVLVLSTHGYWQYHPDPRDLWRWTGPGLREQIETAGFEVLSTRGILNPGAAGLQIFQDFVVARVPHRAQQAVGAILQQLVGAVDAVSHAGEDEASVFLVVARRSEHDPQPSGS